MNFLLSQVRKNHRLRLSSIRAMSGTKKKSSSSFFQKWYHVTNCCRNCRRLHSHRLAVFHRQNVHTLIMQNVHTLIMHSQSCTQPPNALIMHWRTKSRTKSQTFPQSTPAGLGCMGKVQGTYAAMYWPSSKASPPSHQRIAGGPRECLLFFLLAPVYCQGKRSKGAADGSPLLFYDEECIFMIMQKPCFIK